MTRPAATLWQRTALLVVFIATVSFVLIMSMITWYRVNLIRHEGVVLVRGYVAMTRTALATMSPEAYAAALAKAQAHNPDTAVALVRNPPGANGKAPWLPAMQALIADLKTEWGADAVRLTPLQHQQLLVHVQGDWWLQIEAAPLGGHWPWGLLLALPAGTLLFSIGLGWFVGHLVRPLQGMEAAAASFAAGGNPVLPAEGPLEIRRLAERLGSMMADIRHHEAERRTMLAGLPHDLRAPLTRVRLRVALLNPEAAASFNNDLQAIEHITAQFIDYLRGLEPDSTNRETFNLGELLQAIADSYASAGKPLQLSMPATPVLVSGHALMLRRVVDNLVSNAFHHGQPPVHISLVADAGKQQLVIEDAGPGIPADKRELVRRPFEQLDSERSHNGQVGLGLAVVDRIMASHGASLSLGDSALGGLRVVINLDALLVSKH